MMNEKNLIFVSDECHLNSKIPGGVQLCTTEYYNLLTECGFNIEIFPVKHTRKILPRIKMKIGIDNYNRYDIPNIFPILKNKIDQFSANFIALNQVDFIRLAKPIKEEYGNKVKIIILSHGNDSGDFLHEIVRAKNNFIKKTIQTWRLGTVLRMESEYFIKYTDYVFCLSDTEKEINHWFGALQSIVIPRTFTPNFLEWKPVQYRMGWVGTLNHKPNFDGLIAFLDEAMKLDCQNWRIRIVGGGNSEAAFLKEKYPIVEYLGRLTDEELEQEAASWQLFLNPIFWYSRGATTKLAKAISWGLPVISSVPGNRGYVMKLGSIITASTPKEFALLTQKCLNDKTLLYLNKRKIELAAVSGLTFKDIASQIDKMINEK